MDYYILDGHTPVATTKEKWEQWDRGPARDKVLKWDRIGNVLVSTTFVGLIQRLVDPEDTQFFMTMTLWLDNPMLERWARHATWDDALAGHEAAVQAVKDEQA